MSHIRVRATALVIRDDAVLLVEYDDKGIHYNLPGGGAEPGETITEAVQREVLEETAAEVEVGPLALVYEFAPHRQSGNYLPTEKHGLHLIFACTLKPGSVPRLPDQPDPHQSAVRWIPLGQLDAILLIPNIQEHIKAYASSRAQIELTQDYRLERFQCNCNVPNFPKRGCGAAPE